MRCSNLDDALIPFEKLEGYSLNPDHSEGRHKAIVFQSALGLGLEGAEELRLALRNALATNDITPIERNPYGQKYQLDFEMTRYEKRAMLRSIWIIRDAESFPRLVTCYVL